MNFTQMLKAHWLPWAWADTLIKRFLEAAAGWLGLVLIVRFLESSIAASGGNGLNDVAGSRLALLFPLLASLFFVLRGTYRTIVHPIRAAATGRFLDEEALVGVPAYRGVPPIDESTPTQRESG